MDELMRNVYCFRITLLQQLLLLIPFIVMVIILTIGYYYIFGFTTPEYFEIAWIIFTFLVVVLPVLMLHIQYLLKIGTMF